MATDHGPSVDSSYIYDDDEVLEKELRDALKSEGEIELFKLINKSLRVRAELADSETVRTMLVGMWENVAAFFEAITAAKTLAGLTHDDDLVVLHQRMLANFDVVSTINGLFKAAKDAEKELIAKDQMDHDTEEIQ